MLGGKSLKMITCLEEEPIECRRRKEIKRVKKIYLEHEIVNFLVTESQVSFNMRFEFESK